MPFSIKWNSISSLNKKISNVIINNSLGTIIILGTSTTGNTLSILNLPSTWTTNNLLTTGRSIAYNGTNTYYAVGDGNAAVIASSDNGSSWSTVSSPLSTCNDIIYTNPYWIACGSIIAYYDGISWTQVNTGLTQTTKLYYDSSIPRIYAMGQGSNTMAYASSVTSTWSTLGKYAFYNNITSMHGPATYTSGRIWVGLGNTTNTLAWSRDGSSNWTGIGTSIFNSYGFNAVHGTDSSGNPLWVAVGQATVNTIAKSNDGSANWVGLGKTIFSSAGYGVGYGADGSGNPLWVAVGSGTDHTIATSVNGTAWVGLGKTIFSTAGYGVSYGVDSSGNPLWVAVGSGTNTIATSTDGNTWNGIVVSVFSTSGRSVTQGADSSGVPLWVATGEGTNTIATSRNGIEWLGVQGSTSIFSSCFAASYGIDISGNPRWVAVGQTTNTIATSSNGISWSAVPNSRGAAGAGTFSNGLGLSYGVDSAGLPLWVAVGLQNSGNSAATSRNGTTWVGLAKTTSIGTGYGVAQAKFPKYIATSTGSINMKGSFEGNVWYYIKSPFTIATNDVFWNQTQKLWVAVGEGTNTIAYSSNGIKWTGLGTTFFSVRGNKVKYSSTLNKWYAVGEGTNTLITSSDGINWTAINTANYVDISGIGLYVS